jgi:glycosyltransferase involved in cell wall biosynthesis
MNVLITVNAAWNIWNFRQPIVRSLREDGHSVTALAPPDESVGHLEKAGCRFLPLAMNVKGLSPLSDLLLFDTFQKTFALNRPDIILSYTIKNNLFGALAAKRCGIPFIPNVTGLGTAFLSGGALKVVAEALYRSAFRGLPVVFFQNSDDWELFTRRRLIEREQGRLLPGSGIDLSRFGYQHLPQNDGGLTFLMISRLLRDKGVLEYVEAARQMKVRGIRARFQLLGAADAKNRSAVSAAAVEEWHREGTIEYLGTLSDVRPAIRAADCVVLPSYREGAPRTLIEAAAMGRPVIATDVPGCRSVVEHGATGLLCLARDASSLADALVRVSEMSFEARAAMGKAGRQKMEREFDEEFVVTAYRQAIDELQHAA